MTKIINDITKLTNIPKATCDAILQKINYCIVHSVYESELQNITDTEIDLGIGILYIKHEDNDLMYQFIPSSNLEKLIYTTIVEKQSPLTLAAEEALREKVLHLYKELF